MVSVSLGDQGLKSPRSLRKGSLCSVGDRSIGVGVAYPPCGPRRVNIEPRWYTIGVDKVGVNPDSFFIFNVLPAKHRFFRVGDAVRTSDLCRVKANRKPLFCVAVKLLCELSNPQVFLRSGDILLQRGYPLLRRQWRASG